MKKDNVDGDDGFDDGDDSIDDSIDDGDDVDDDDEYYLRLRSNHNLIQSVNNNVVPTPQMNSKGGGTHRAQGDIVDRVPDREELVRK